MGKQVNERIQIHPDGSREYWRDVPGYKGMYRVSDRGRVKSLGRHITRIRYGKPYTSYKKEKILFLQECTSQHLVTKLSNDGGYKNVFVHRLVLEAFVGPCPEGMEGCHENGDGTDNRLTNLRWDTHKANHADSVRHGRVRRGELAPSAKLTAYDVLAIRSDCENGVTHRDIARTYGISVAHVSRIRNAKEW